MHSSSDLYDDPFLQKSSGKCDFDNNGKMCVQHNERLGGIPNRPHVPTLGRASLAKSRGLIGRIVQKRRDSDTDTQDTYTDTITCTDVV